MASWRETQIHKCENPECVRAAMMPEFDSYFHQLITFVTKGREIGQGSLYGIVKHVFLVLFIVSCKPLGLGIMFIHGTIPGFNKSIM